VPAHVVAVADDAGDVPEDIAAGELLTEDAAAGVAPDPPLVAGVP
jgi:hypothetical protein